MALLSSLGSTATVEVILREWRDNRRGGRSLEEVGRVLVSGRITPTTSADIERYAGSGTAVAEATRFVTAEWPGNADSQVMHDGRRWDVIGAVQEQRSSRMTARDTVILSAKGSA